MTDLETMRELLDRRKIAYTLTPPTPQIPRGPRTVLGGSPYTVLELMQGTEGVIGYNGFSTEWYFDLDGNLVEVGVWE